MLELVGSNHVMSQYFSLVLPSSNVELVALKMSVLMKMQVKRMLLEKVQIEVFKKRWLTLTGCKDNCSENHKIKA